jgi:hypothetical protein
MKPKRKISESLKNNDIEMQRWYKILERQRKPVSQFNKNGEYIGTYESISIASHKTGICRTNINNCCLNKTGSKTAGGYIWKYECVNSL